MTEDDSQAGAIQDDDLPPEERIDKPDAPDDVKVPAPGDELPTRGEISSKGIYDHLEEEGYVEVPDAEAGHHITDVGKTDAPEES